MADRPDEKGDVGLVLAGGGARGAYEIGALSVLLPELVERPEGDLPRILVGTSAGAINTAWLASKAHLLQGEAQAVLAEGEQIWGEMEWNTAVKPLLSLSEARIGLKWFLSLLHLGGVEGMQLLDPSPLKGKLENGPLIPGGEGGLDFNRIGMNVGRPPRPLHAAAVVATRAATSLSVVFHTRDTSAGDAPPFDESRGITYADIPLRVDHVMASAAIPTVFPAVAVEDERTEIDGWYFDGGTRLNTPIKPALQLGARRLIVIAMNSPWLEDPRTQARHRFASRDKAPAAVDGAASIIQSVLVDPLVNDLHNLVRTNEDLERGGAAAQKDGRYVIPYIVIAPPDSDTIGQLASKAFRDSRPKGDVGFIGGQIDAGRDPARGELLSYFFFESAFAQRLIQQGKDDANDWIENHPGNLWEKHRL